MVGIGSFFINRYILLVIIHICIILLMIFLIKKIKKENFTKKNNEKNCFKDIFDNKEKQIAKVKENAGKRGEARTFFELSKIQKYGYLFKNKIIPCVNKEEELYPEVDALFLTYRGLYVIESKNQTGKFIFDETTSKMIRYKKNGDEEICENPIIENQFHIKAIEENLETYIPIYSIIVFNDEADLSENNIKKDDIVLTTYEKMNDEIIEKMKITQKIENDELMKIKTMIEKFKTRKR